MSKKRIQQSYTPTSTSDYEVQFRSFTINRIKISAFTETTEQYAAYAHFDVVDLASGKVLDQHILTIPASDWNDFTVDAGIKSKLLKELFERLQTEKPTVIPANVTIGTIEDQNT